MCNTLVHFLCLSIASPAVIMSLLENRASDDQAIGKFHLW